MLRRTRLSLCFQNLLEDVEGAAKAAITLRMVPGEKRTDALISVVNALDKNRDHIFEQNAIDCDAFQQRYTNDAGVRPSFVLSNVWMDQLLGGMKRVAAFPDPLTSGEEKKMATGITVKQVSVPLGLVGVLFKNRPRVTLDSIALCIKSGNALLIDGGSSLVHTNRAVVSIVREALDKTAVETGIPPQCLILNDAPRQDYVKTTQQWLRMNDFVDIVVASGSRRLEEFVMKNTTIPLICGAGRVCCLYIDKSASLETALKVALNAKLQRPSASNSITNLIIHKEFPHRQQLLIKLAKRGVELVGDQATVKVIPTCPLATEDDWTGYAAHQSTKLCVKTVGKLSEAVSFIETYSCHQSDGIVAAEASAIDEFVRLVDSAIVHVNSSTRFSTADCFGQGADIALSTSKIHCRGPVGLEALCSRKYVVTGVDEGSIRE